MIETYARRILLWPVILVQVSGMGLRNQLNLLLSALASPALSLRGLPRWQDPVLLYDTAVSVHGVGYFRLRQKCDDLWHVLPWREREVLKFIRKTLQPGDVFIDAGANIGIYSVAAAKLVGSRGRVIAVEMMPDTAERLREHLDLNGAAQVWVVEMALTQQAGELLQAQVPEGRFGQARLASTKANTPKSRSVSVESTTLQELIHGVPRVALMKMDIEGAELMALRGAGPLIERIDAIVFENRDATCAVSDHLISLGYRVRRLDGANCVADRASHEEIRV